MEDRVCWVYFSNKGLFGYLRGQKNADNYFFPVEFATSAFHYFLLEIHSVTSESVVTWNAVLQYREYSPPPESPRTFSLLWLVCSHLQTVYAVDFTFYQQRYGKDQYHLLSKPARYPPILVLSGIWVQASKRIKLSSIFCWPVYFDASSLWTLFSNLN